MESLNSLYQVIDKVETLNSLFGLIVICVIAGCVLVLYSRHINRFYKPLRIVLQFCMAAFLSFGLIGLVALAVTNFVGQFYIALFLSLALSGAISLAALFLINRKNKKVKDLQQEKELAEKNLAEALKTCDELRENVRNLESDVANLNSQIDALKSGKSELEKKLDDLQQEKELAEKNLAEALKTCDELRENVRNLESDTANLKSQIDALKSEKSELEKKLDDLQQENHTRKNQLEKITSSLTAGAKEFNGHHYKAFEELYITWDLARQRCEEKGGHLATITSQATQDFIVKNFLRTKRTPFDYLFYGYWIGGYTNGKRECFWVTGEKWEYSNLGANDVIASNANLRIDGFMSNFGKWSFSSGNLVTGYICEWDF